MTRLKTSERCSMENARLRQWLKFVRDNKPKYAWHVAEVALDTDHRPDDVRLCLACGWLASNYELMCEHCQAESEDYKDELEEQAVPHRGY